MGQQLDEAFCSAVMGLGAPGPLSTFVVEIVSHFLSQAGMESAVPTSGFHASPARSCHEIVTLSIQVGLKSRLQLGAGLLAI